MLAIGLVILVGVLVWEIPHVLKSGGAGSRPQAVAAPPTVTPPLTRRLPRSLRFAGDGLDPFAVRLLPDGDPQAGAVAGGRDPFAIPVATAPATSSPPPAVTSPLPERIVIGTPGGNRVAVHGWIVILASIPTGNGRAGAAAFAGRVRAAGFRSASVLNSSNRRPLRGGYWVVYTGPFHTLSEVERGAALVHGAGYRTAYIRELIVYR